MRFYLELVSNTFQANLAYRLKVFLHLLHRVAGLLVEVSIWSALLQAGGVETEMGTVTLADMTTYALLSTAISVFVDNQVILRFQEKIRSGDIALDLIKPMSFKLYMLAQNLGENLFKVCTELLPVVGIGIVLFGIQLPTATNLLLFAIVLVLGFVLYFLIAVIIGQLAFWFLTIWHLDKLLNDVLKIFSGRFVPLWFFPGWLQRISLYLPFRLVYFAPASIFLGKLTVPQGLSVVWQQLLWIGGLLIIDRLIWANGTRKLVVQGG